VTGRHGSISYLSIFWVCVALHSILYSMIGLWSQVRPVNRGCFLLLNVWCNQMSAYICEICVHCIFWWQQIIYKVISATQRKLLHKFGSFPSKKDICYGKMLMDLKVWNIMMRKVTKRGKYEVLWPGHVITWSPWTNQIIFSVEWIQNSEVNNVWNVNHNPKGNYKIECRHHGPPTNAKVGSGAIHYGMIMANIDAFPHI
jgi:hypothetical protein